MYPARVPLKQPPNGARDVSDAATIESGAENVRGKGNVFNRISKQITGAVGMFGKPKVDPSSKALATVAAPPPLPTKIGKDEVAAAGDPLVPLPAERRKAQKARLAAKVNRIGDALKRFSFQKKDRAVEEFDLKKGLAVIAREKEEEAAQDTSDLPSPRYADLPSILEFCVDGLGWENKDDEDAEDDERTDLTDKVDPKIDGSTIIVMSFGEGTVQSGMASQDAGPDHVLPCLAGEPQSFNVRVMDKGEKNPIKFGQDAANRRGIYALEWFNDTESGPPKYTKVGDMMAYNSSHCLRRALKQDAVIFPMNVDMSLERRTKLACLAFERVGARAVRIVSEEKVALQYVTKQDYPTGIIVDIGHSMTRCVGIVDGEIADVSLQRTIACGKTMTLRMFSLLKQKTALFDQNVTGMEFAREAKEKHAFALSKAPIGKDLTESVREFEQVFELNDGQYVTLAHERYMCAESLFQPEKDEGKLSYYKATSIQQTIVDCLKTMDRDLWSDLLPNIVIIGGGANLSGFKERLEAELFKLLPPIQFNKLNITLEPHAGWQGARLSSLKQSDIGLWISRREWRQGGESAVADRIKEQSGSMKLG